MFAHIRQHKKKWLSYSAAVVLYVLSVYFLFYSVQLLYAGVAITLLLFSLHFTVISAQKYKIYIRKRYRVLWLIISGLFLFISTQYNSNLIIFAYIVYHIGLYLFLYNKHWFLTNNISPNPWIFCNVGMYLFTIFCTVTYSILMVGILENIPFDCDVIYESYDAVGQAVSSPRDNFSDRIGWWIDNISNTKNIDNTSTLNEWRSEFAEWDIWDGIVNEREKINKNICTTVFENIQTQFQKPGFQAAILFPLFIILSPIIRIVLYLVSAITFLVIELLIKSNIYKKRKVMKEVEEWY